MQSRLIGNSLKGSRAMVLGNSIVRLYNREHVECSMIRAIKQCLKGVTLAQLRSKILSVEKKVLC
jgi:hypothetical protein